ncbi:hypothetical protein [Actinopolymorpha alba]|uniref:hypothetical protein n=1 Tax=Actinopolymorpha alba TaxID=533267 RepID=UPI00037EF5BA|nr:hypothetical protein [Actinopolymorpha alba]
MARSGDHRIRHLARWVATPVLLLAAAFVFFAVYQGETSMLTGAAVASLVAGVLAVAVFDIELIRSRRAHGAERVAQARSYAAMYAAHVRVMAEGFALQAHQSRKAGRAANVDEVAAASVVVDEKPFVDEKPVTVAVPAVEVKASGDEKAVEPQDATIKVAAEKSSDEKAAKPQGATIEVAAEKASDEKVEAGAAAAQQDADDQETPAAKASRDADSGNQDSAAKDSGDEVSDQRVKAGAAAVPIPLAKDGAAGDTSKAPEMWDSLRDAPTVVDLMAWEVRARLAADEEQDAAKATAEDKAAEPEKAASERRGA